MGAIETPQIIEAGDYHDFEGIQEDYRKIIPGIKVKEIGFNPRLGLYIGLVYLGVLADPENGKMLGIEKKHLEQTNDDFDWNSCIPIRP